MLRLAASFSAIKYESDRVLILNYVPDYWAVKATLMVISRMKLRILEITLSCLIYGTLILTVHNLFPEKLIHSR